MYICKYSIQHIFFKHNRSSITFAKERHSLHSYKLATDPGSIQASANQENKALCIQIHIFPNFSFFFFPEVFCEIAVKLVKKKKKIHFLIVFILKFHFTLWSFTAFSFPEEQTNKQILGYFVCYDFLTTYVVFFLTTFYFN